MAKKTNYLTELIERHERWKAEGGERLEEEEQAVAQDLYVTFDIKPVLNLIPFVSCTHTGPPAVTPRTCGISGLSGTPGERSGVPTTRSRSRGRR